MPNPTLHDTMSADFAAGSSTGTYVAETGDGELTLAPAKGTEFSGTDDAGRLGDADLEHRRHGRRSPEAS